MAIPIQRARTQSWTHKSGIARITQGKAPDARTQNWTRFSIEHIRHMCFLYSEILIQELGHKVGHKKTASLESQSRTQQIGIARITQGIAPDA